MLHFLRLNVPSVWVTPCSRHAEFSNIITQLPLLLTSSIPCIHSFGDCHCYTKVMWQEVVLESLHIYQFLLPETRSKRKHIWVFSGREGILDNISMHETHQLISYSCLFSHLCLEFIFSTAEKRKVKSTMSYLCPLLRRNAAVEPGAPLQPKLSFKLPVIPPPSQLVCSPATSLSTPQPLSQGIVAH